MAAKRKQLPSLQDIAKPTLHGCGGKLIRLTHDWVCDGCCTTVTEDQYLTLSSERYALISQSAVVRR
jgi:hypothetical protein